MLIRKTQQPSDFPSNSIHDAYNSSTTNAYSCNYVNTMLSGESASIGTLSNLETEAKSCLVSAVNEVDTLAVENTTNIGTLSNLTTDNKTCLVSAINEVESSKQNTLTAGDNITIANNIISASVSQGPQGPTGPAGPGIAIGGTAGQVLAKKSATNYDTKWIDIEVNTAGIISMFAGSTAPAGWFLCQGQAVSRTEYANLFSAIGTTYGTGDGSTTFNLPNLKGRVIVGQDTSDANFNALGETGGATEVTLDISEMPIHSHIYYGIGGNNSLSQNSMVTVGEASVSNLQKGVSDAGGGQPHNNLQPYIVMNYIIKI